MSIKFFQICRKAFDFLKNEKNQLKKRFFNQKCFQIKLAKTFYFSIKIIIFRLRTIIFQEIFHQKMTKLAIFLNKNVQNCSFFKKNYNFLSVFRLKWSIFQKKNFACEQPIILVQILGRGGGEFWYFFKNFHFSEN